MVSLSVYLEKVEESLPFTVMSLVYELGCIRLYLYSYKFIWYDLEKPSLLAYGYKTVDSEKQHQNVVRNILSIIHYQFYRKDATAALCLFIRH